MTSDTKLYLSWWAGKSKLHSGGRIDDTRSGRHFYVPMPYSGMLVRINIRQETRQITEVGKDQADASLIFTKLKKIGDI